MKDGRKNIVLERLREKEMIAYDLKQNKDVDLVIDELELYHAELIAQDKELVESHHQIYQSKEEFRTLFFGCPTPYLVIDQDFVVKKFNLSADECFSFVKGFTLSNNLFPYIKQEYIAPFSKWLKAGNFEQDLTIVMLCQKKYERRFKLKAIQHPNKEDLFLSLIDVEEEYRLKEHLEEQSKLASMGELIDIIVHQWMNPLSIIKLRVEMLQLDSNDGYVDEQRIDQYVDEQKSSLDHLTATLKNFRDFLRPNEAVQTTNLKALLQNIFVLLKEPLIIKRTELILDIDDNIMVSVYTNEFLHVFINLINNALEAFDERNIDHRRIKIYSKCTKKNNLKIYVEDNAGGIKSNKPEQIFEKNITTKQSGSGIGLYLAKIILEKIDAKISVKNTEEGCCFKIFGVKMV